MAKEKGILSHDTNSKPFEKRAIYTGTLGQTMSQSSLGVQTPVGDVVGNGSFTINVKQDGLVQVYADLYSEVTKSRKRRKQISGQGKTFSIRCFSDNINTNLVGF